MRNIFGMFAAAATEWNVRLLRHTRGRVIRNSRTNIYIYMCIYSTARVISFIGRIIAIGLRASYGGIQYRSTAPVRRVQNSGTAARPPSRQSHNRRYAGVPVEWKKH